MKNDEVLIIDCQIMQTAAFDRGMGKYTSSLIKALSANKNFKEKYSNVYLLLNSNLNFSDERQQLISSLVSNSKLLIIDLPTDIGVDNLQKLEKAQKAITQSCERICRNSKVSFLITAPFFVGFPSVFPEQRNIKKYSIVYDFIPYRIWNKQKIFPDNIYFQHFKLFLDADHLLTISEFVRQDLIKLFGFSERKVTSIDGGPFEQTIPNNISSRPIKERYIIYPSAPIIHKNNIKAVQGFEEFKKQQKDKFKLVITSTFDEETKDSLKKYSEDIIFTGNISDQELYRYYHHASTLLFASLSEGLGMPILEAVVHGLPVACSDIPVLTEISDNGLYLFDPTSTTSIANSLSNAISKNDFKIKQKSYLAIKSKYSWHRSAEILLSVLVTEKLTVVAKKSLLIISEPTNTANKQSRFIEHVFAQFYDKFDVTLQFNKKRNTKQELPSYVASLDFSPKTEIFDYKLDVTKKSFFKRNKDNFTIQIVGNSKDVSFKKGTISVLAIEDKIDLYLEFNDWRYSFKADEKNNYEQIVNKIISEMT